MSKKNVNAMVSAMGVLSAIVDNLSKYIVELGGNVFELLYRLGTEDGQDTLKQIAQLIVGVKEKVVEKAKEILSVLVNYDLSINEVVKQAGFVWVNDDINSEHFSTKQKGQAEVVVEDIAFNRAMSSDEAIAELAKLGFRPAELHERCAHQKKYGTQHTDPVVVLGSVWRYLRGDRNVPVLDGHGGDRGLFLHWFGLDWDALCRFAAVRK